MFCTCNLTYCQVICYIALYTASVFMLCITRTENMPRHDKVKIDFLTSSQKGSRKHDWQVPKNEGSHNFWHEKFLGKITNNLCQTGTGANKHPLNCNRRYCNLGLAAPVLLSGHQQFSSANKSWKGRKKPKNHTKQTTIAS